MFMECMARSWEPDLEKEILRQDGQLTEKKELDIDLSFQPLRREIHELYKIMWGLRVSVSNAYNNEPVKEASFKEICRNDFVTWINYFVWTRDPRLVNMGLRPDIPFVLTQAQETALNIINKCFSTRRSILVEKSRAEGITELLCAYDVWHWTYTQGFQGLWGSRVERLVDSKGAPGSIFPRLRRIIYGLPEKMRPRAYRKEKNEYDKLFNLENPDMDSFIRGESGDNIGRGDRSTLAKVDEKAHVANPVSCDEALAYNTECQIDISTPNGQDHFYEKRNSGQVEVITLWWWRNPSKNPFWRENKRPAKGKCAWYEFQLLTRDPVLIAKEIDINYLASVLGSMIPADWVQCAVDLDLKASGPRIAGLDLAAAGKDKSVYITRKGPVVSLPQIIPVDSPSKAAWMASDLGKADRIATLIYDKSGLGEDIYPVLKEGDKKVKFDLIGLYGQQRASDRLYDAEGLKGHEKFRNGRGEWWWEMRKRFERVYLHVNGKAQYDDDQMISLPSGDQDFINQISSPLHVQAPNGKIGVESKREMASRNVKSPDKADALIYSFFNPKSVSAVVPHFSYANSTNFHNFEIDFTRVQDLYISVFHTEEMNIYVLICSWDFTMRKLRLYYEKQYDYFDPEQISEDLFNARQGHEVKMWIGNTEVFDGMTDGRRTVWTDYQQAGMNLQVNWSHDVKKSIHIADTMFRDNTLEVHDTCEKTMQQVRNWVNVRGQPQSHLYYALCLCQILTMLQTKKVISYEPKKRPSIYNKR